MSSGEVTLTMWTPNAWVDNHKVRVRRVVSAGRRCGELAASRGRAFMAADQESDLRMYCRNCGFDLRGSTGKCPECGQAFDSGDVRTVYRSLYDRNVHRLFRRLVVIGASLLLLQAALYALGSAWLYWQYHADWEKEQVATAWVRQVGGQVQTYCVGHSWLHLFQGGYLMDRVVDVSLRKRRIQDADLAYLTDLPYLTFLDLSQTQIGDAGLMHLSRLSNLHSLTLTHTCVTDAGLVRIGALSCLEQMNLSYTHVTDAGMLHISSLRALRVLDLDGTRVTDAGLASLSGMAQLRLVRARGTAITDAGVRCLGNVCVLSDVAER